MPLIKDGRIAPDRWITVADGESMPDRVPAIISLARWQAEYEALARRGAPLGLRLKSDEGPEAVAGDIGHFAVIALEFPIFRDGRAYSSARLLRERYDYRGELRAVGNVLADQYQFMHRCGFDAFEVANEAAATAWRRAMDEITVWYQPTGDGRPTATALRHRQVAAE